MCLRGSNSLYEERIDTVLTTPSPLSKLRYATFHSIFSLPFALLRYRNMYKNIILTDLLHIVSSGQPQLRSTKSEEVSFSKSLAILLICSGWPPAICISSAVKQGGGWRV